MTPTDLRRLAEAAKTAQEHPAPQREQFEAVAVLYDAMTPQAVVALLDVIDAAQAYIDDRTVGHAAALRSALDAIKRLEGMNG